jgi:hypothetical protein
MTNGKYNTHTNQVRESSSEKTSNFEMLDGLSENLGYAEGIVYVLSERQGIDDAMARSLEAVRLFIKKASALAEEIAISNRPQRKESY